MLDLYSLILNGLSTILPHLLSQVFLLFFKLTVLHHTFLFSPTSNTSSPLHSPLMILLLISIQTWEMRELLNFPTTRAPSMDLLFLYTRDHVSMYWQPFHLSNNPTSSGPFQNFTPTMILPVSCILNFDFSTGSFPVSIKYRLYHLPLKKYFFLDPTSSLTVAPFLYSPL